MNELRSVDASEALKLAASGTALIDVREKDEWDRGHSPLAVSLPLSTLQDGLGSLPTDAPILVVCLSGGRSLRATRSLLNAGYDVINVEGGMLAVSAAGGELEAAEGVTPTIG